MIWLLASGYWLLVLGQMVKKTIYHIIREWYFSISSFVCPLMKGMNRSIEAFSFFVLPPGLPKG